MYEVRTGRLGKSVFATRPIARGQRILSGWGEILTRRTRHSLQVGVEAHVVIRTEIELINHCCEPNCGVLIRPDRRDFAIHALRPIGPGEELTTDYATFESEIEYLSRNPCLCGAASCRGRITGYWDLPEDRRAAYGRYVAPYLRTLGAAAAAGHAAAPCLAEPTLAP